MAQRGKLYSFIMVFSYYSGIFYYKTTVPKELKQIREYAETNLTINLKDIELNREYLTLETG